MKIWTAFIFDLYLQRFKIRKAIADNRTTLLIESVLAVEKIHNAAADDSVQSHQGPLMPTREAGPIIALMDFPELDDRFPIHATTLTSIHVDRRQRMEENGASRRYVKSIIRRQAGAHYG